MKKIFIIAMAILSMAFYCNVYAADLDVIWEYSGVPADGFEFVFWRTDTPPADETNLDDPNLWHFSLQDGAARVTTLDSDHLLKDTSYTMKAFAYNTASKGPYSDPALTSLGTAVFEVYQPSPDRMPIIVSVPGVVNNLSVGN